MNILGKVMDVLGGSAVQSIASTAMKYFPPSMSEKEKKEFSVKLTEIENSKNLELIKEANAAEAEFNSRMIAMEGSMQDLKAVPFVGAFIIFLRGCFRPLCGYCTLYADWMWFSGSWVTTEQMSKVLLMINLIVLTFYFGERTIKNLMPLFEPILLQWVGGKR